MPFYSKFSSSIDSRSLALFRIVIGLSLIYNIVFQRLIYVGTLIQNDKLIPHQVIDDYYGSPIPLFRLFDSEFWSYGYLILLLLLVVVFTIGRLNWWLRLITFVLYGIVNASYTYLSHGPEFLMEAALLWSIFLPVNNSISFLKENKNQIIKSVVVSGFYLQLLLIYTSSWLLKDGDAWHSNQVMEVLAHDRIHATSMLAKMNESIPMLRAFTSVGFWLEVIVSILILLAIKFKRIRLFTALGILILHTSMVVLLDVGHFWSIGLAFSCVFIPSCFYHQKVDSSSTFHEKLNRFNVLALSILVLFIIHGNMYAWKKQGYLSDFLKTVPLSDIALRTHYKDPGFASGFYHQSWRFFSGDLPDNLGDFVYVGIDENGDEYELISNKKISSIENYHFAKNNYSNAQFVFAVYLKYYHQRFPKSSIEEWLRLQANTISSKNSYTSYKLYMHKRNFVLGDSVTFIDELIELVTIDE